MARSTQIPPLTNRFPASSFRPTGESRLMNITSTSGYEGISKLFGTDSDGLEARVLEGWHRTGISCVAFVTWSLCGCPPLHLRNHLRRCPSCGVPCASSFIRRVEQRRPSRLCGLPARGDSSTATVRTHDLILVSLLRASREHLKTRAAVHPCELPRPMLACHLPNAFASEYHS